MSMWVTVPLARVAAELGAKFQETLESSAQWHRNDQRLSIASVKQAIVLETPLSGSDSLVAVLVRWPQPARPDLFNYGARVIDKSSNEAVKIYSSPGSGSELAAYFYKALVSVPDIDLSSTSISAALKTEAHVPFKGPRPCAVILTHDESGTIRFYAQAGQGFGGAEGMARMQGVFMYRGEGLLLDTRRDPIHPSTHQHTNIPHEGTMVAIAIGYLDNNKKFHLTSPQRTRSGLQHLEGAGPHYHVSDEHIAEMKLCCNNAGYKFKFVDSYRKEIKIVE